MAQSIVLPRGGLGRGMLAGLMLSSVSFVVLSAVFPLNRPVRTPVEVPEATAPPTISIGATQFGAGADNSGSVIFAPTAIASPNTPGTAPTTFNAPTTGVAPTATDSAPIAAVSLQAPTTSLSVTTLEALTEVAPVVEVPSIEIEAPTTIKAPDVGPESANVEPKNDPANFSEAAVSLTALANANPVDASQAATSGEPASKPVGSFASTEQGIVSPTSAVGEAAVSNTSTGPAFETYALTFSNFDDKPLISIILLAETIEQADAVSALSIPVTLAVSASNPDVGTIVAWYRQSGGEVVLMLPTEGALSLHKGDDPAIVAESLGFSLADAVGVIGVLDGPEGDINQDSDMVNAVLNVLKPSGHALITTTSLGLNRAEQLASAAQVYSTSVNRQIDASPGKITVIRAMDKTVLQLGDARSSTVFGMASNDTLSALAFWLKSSKAQTVTMAPVSAAILAN